MIDTIKEELANLATSRIAWFLAGLFLSGTSVPDVIDSLRTFVGI